MAWNMTKRKYFFTANAMVIANCLANLCAVRLIFFIDGLNFELFGGVGEIASFRPYLKTACNLHDLKDAL